MINAIIKIVTLKSLKATSNHFGPKDAEKAYIPYYDNLIDMLNIVNYILNRVLIDPAVSISLQYVKSYE